MTNLTSVQTISVFFPPQSAKEQMANIRTFLAVDISEQQRASAEDLVEHFSISGSTYRWSDSENLHVTLNFIGDVLETEINEVCTRARKVAETFSSFEMSIAGAGAFPSSDKPRIIWTGVEQGSEELIDLQAQLAVTMDDMGFPPEPRKYHPHLTLGRIKRAGRFDEEMAQLISRHQSFNCGSTMVRELVVYSSFLDRSGPTYTPVSRIRFGS